jgi:hypothetical protein
MFADRLLSYPKSKNYRAVLNSLKQLSIVQPQNAAAYSKEYIQINDSLQKKRSEK